MKKCLIIMLGATIMASCNEKIDTSEVKQEMENRKLKRITKGEIMAAAEKRGKLILDSADLLWKNNLSKADNTNPDVTACSLNSIDGIGELTLRYQASVLRTGIHPINKSNKPAGIDQQLLDAYLYNEENKVASNINMQEEDQYILFTSPIYVSDKSCLACHGNKSEKNKKAVAQISQKYPDADTTALKLNKLAGMWSIRMNKQEVVKTVK